MRVQSSPEFNQINTPWIELNIQTKNITSRTNHSGCMHNSTLYVYGGYDINFGILADFYCIDLKQSLLRWKQIRTQKLHPGKRRNHTLRIFHNQILLFGGQVNPIQSTNKLSFFNINTSQWTNEISLQIPEIDSHQSVIYQNKMIILGGYFSKRATYNNDIYEYDLEKKILKKYNFLKKPIGRTNFSCCVRKSMLYLFGGYNSQNLNDLWVLDLEKLIWNEIKSNGQTIPQPRRGHNIIQYQNKLFLFGGIQSLTKQKNDIYIFDIARSAWTQFKFLQKSSSMEKRLDAQIESSQSSKKKQHLVFRKNTSIKTNLILSLVEDKNSPLKLKRNVTMQQKRYRTQYQQSKPRTMDQIIKETKARNFRIKKYNMLKDINETKIEKSHRLSKAEQAMQHSLNIFGNQKKKSQKFVNIQSKSNLISTISYEENKKFILGKIPCARDGQIGLRYQQNLLIFGGDRHMMSFNDLFFFKLEKGLKMVSSNP